MNILITGGSAGLGRSITESLGLDLTNNIFFTFNKSAEQAKELAQNFSNVTPFQCEFGKGSSVENLLAKIEEWNIDVLINNAFTKFEKKHFSKLTASSFQSSFEDNIVPTLKITQKAISVFRRKKKGKIITILSAAIIGTPPAGWSTYVANKNYLLSMSKSWATENIKYNISSNCISPSFMNTNFTSDTDERILENMVKKHPLKKILTTKEVADSVNFLVSTTQHINGQNLVINAGESL